jgi:2-desacetyl-2-hydroxyethyl bacteriochlorophyllide A dehydrogenase
VRVVRVREHGGPHVLKIEDDPEPVAGLGEVVVDVTHVGLNHLDVWVRRGVPGHRFPLPLIPGADIAGIRRDTGERVVVHPATSCLACPACLAGRQDLCPRFRIRGERCDGGCAERIVVPIAQLLPADGLDPAEAASLPLAALTAWHLLFHRAKLEAGQRVVVMGAAGGVGTLLVQLAGNAGAHVAGVASTAEKRAAVERLGAEQVWDPAGAVAAAKAWSGRGVDLVIDAAGGRSFLDGVAMLRWGGTLATYGATAGAEIALDLRVLFFKQLTLVGSTMGTHADLHAAWAAVRAGRLRAVVDRVVPMSEIGRAQAAIEQREVIGKVVLAQDLGTRP